MKKILILSAIAFYTLNVSSYGACKINNLQTDNICTGGASGINIQDNGTSKQIQSNKEDLIRMYQIPTLSLPSSMKNGFPILNPAANCAFGMCQPK